MWDLKNLNNLKEGVRTLLEKLNPPKNSNSTKFIKITNPTNLK
jgi:hypothetical protein